MVAEPVLELAVTTPVELTVTIDGLEEDHVTDLFAALDGEIFAVSVLDAPVFNVNDDGEIVIDDTAIVTVTVQDAIKPPD